MHAWRVTQFGEPAEVLTLQHTSAALKPGTDQLKILVEAAGLGLPDVLMCRGNYPLVPPLPFTPAQEAAGLVLAVGANVDRALLGTRVMGPTLFQQGCGGLAKECLMIAPMTLAIPDGMRSEEAAGFFIPYQTAWVGLVRRGQLTADDTALILGASGSSGAAALQLAKAIGARAIAVAGGDKKTAFCANLGADAVIDHHAENITRRALELTEGRGVSLVYDPVGGEPARAAFEAIGFEGRFIMIGYASGEWPRITLAETLMKNISLMGAMPVGYPPEDMRNAHNEMVSWWTQGKLNILGDHAYSFEEGNRAIAGIAIGHTCGKVVVHVR
ncbi:MAG: NADPH:quinone oxidoreductase family protein [Halioglobus sp.]|nr:NADPH:quinone oxidoreductase family protein [Halioglobus sp.]